MANEKLFGFKLVSDEEKENKVTSPVAPEQHEATVEIQSSAFGVTGAYIDISDTTTSENAVIEKYREISMFAEVDRAISEIVSDAIIVDELKPPVSVSVESEDLPEKIKDRIADEFETVLGLLHFNTKGTDIFRRWYIDGRVNYNIVIDENNPRDGIKELRYIDPKKIKRIRRIEKQNSGGDLQYDMIRKKDVIEYYLYNERGIDNKGAEGNASGVPIAKDSIAHSNSGLFDSKNNMTMSYLHKAIRPANQLRMMEDALVIYRITRAPERRVFYVEVGGLNRAAAEQHLTAVMNKHKSKVVYDVSTGEIKDARRHLSMTEDFWIPRRDGQGTSIDTLQGGQNLSQIEDVEYFKNKLYESLSVPKSRFSEDSQMFGRSSEISRDELKFARFISMLRGRFNTLFDDILGKQLALRGVMTIDEWNQIKKDIHYDYLKDNYFSESVENDLLSARLNILRDVNEYVGRYFSEDWVMKNVLRMTDEEIRAEQTQIKKEGSDKEYDEGQEADKKRPFGEEVEVEPTMQVTEQKEGSPLSEEEKRFLNSMSKYFDEDAYIPPQDDI